MPLEAGRGTKKKGRYYRSWLTLLRAATVSTRLKDHSPAAFDQEEPRTLFFKLRMPVVNVDDLVRLQRNADDIRNVRATPPPRARDEDIKVFYMYSNPTDFGKIDMYFSTRGKYPQSEEEKRRKN